MTADELIKGLDRLVEELQAEQERERKHLEALLQVAKHAVHKSALYHLHTLGPDGLLLTRACPRPEVGGIARVDGGLRCHVTWDLSLFGYLPVTLRLQTDTHGRWVPVSSAKGGVSPWACRPADEGGPTLASVLRITHEEEARRAQAAAENVPGADPAAPPGGQE